MFFVGKYDFSQKISFCFENMIFRLKIRAFRRKLIICSENIISSFENMTYSNNINYVLRNMTLLIKYIFIFVAEKVILEARIQRWRPMEATGGNGGQIPRTDFSPAFQIYSSTNTARTPKALLVWGMTSVGVSIKWTDSKWNLSS